MGLTPKQGHLCLCKRDSELRGKSNLDLWYKGMDRFDFFFSSKQ